MAKLEKGQPITILAWGDSVTEGACLKNEEDRWQVKFVEGLRKLYPRSQIKLVTEAWSAHTSGQYLAAPPGSPHNFEKSVLNVHPDLIVSEFINDWTLTAKQTVQQYSRILRAFNTIGAEWIILTPEYTYPGWMDGPHWGGITDEHFLDRDPRPYVHALRRFASEHHVALADASLRWGRLWRQGIPYTTLLVNGINHPDARGHEIYARSLLSLFGNTSDVR